MLTYEQTTIYETHSDEEGKFIIETDIDDVVLAQIAVDLERVDMLLKPNSSYEIEIVIPNQEEYVSYFERQNPNIKIINSNDDNLYYQYYKYYYFQSCYLHCSFYNVNRYFPQLRRNSRVPVR
mgnify:CR=1 FL=1